MFTEVIREGSVFFSIDFYLKSYVSNHWCRLLLCIKENGNKAHPHWLYFAMSVFISMFPFLMGARRHV